MHQSIQSSVIRQGVVMAGTGLAGDEVIQIQTDLLLKAQGAEEEGLRLTRELFRGVFDILKSNNDSVTAEKQIREFIAEKNAAMTEAQRKGLAQILTTIDTQLKQFYLLEW